YTIVFNWPFFISAKINNIKERPIKYYGIVIFIGLILMVTGAVTMKGNKALALEDDVKILEENVEDLNQKMLNSKDEIIKKEYKNKNNIRKSRRYKKKKKKYKR